MDKEVAFKQGSDLGTSTSGEAIDSIERKNCGTGAESGESPPSSKPAEPVYTIERRSRFWALLDNGTLVCLTVYLKGAVEVKRRLEGERR